MEIISVPQRETLNWYFGGYGSSCHSVSVGQHCQLGPEPCSWALWAGHTPISPHIFTLTFGTGNNARASFKQLIMWPGPGNRVGLWSNWDRYREVGRGQLCVVVIWMPEAQFQVPILSGLPDYSCPKLLLLLRTSELAMVSPPRYYSNSSSVGGCSLLKSVCLPSGLGAPWGQGPAIIPICLTSPQYTHLGKMPWGRLKWTLLHQLYCQLRYESTQIHWLLMHCSFFFNCEPPGACAIESGSPKFDLHLTFQGHSSWVKWGISGFLFWMKMNKYFDMLGENFPKRLLKEAGVPWTKRESWCRFSSAGWDLCEARTPSTSSERNPRQPPASRPGKTMLSCQWVLNLLGCRGHIYQLDYSSWLTRSLTSVSVGFLRSRHRDGDKCTSDLLEKNMWRI